MKCHQIAILFILVLNSCVEATDSESKLSSVSIPTPERDEVGAECEYDEECRSFYCFIDSGDDVGTCTESCDIDSEDCSDDFECRDSEEGPICLLNGVNTCDDEDEASEECAGEEPAGEEPAGEEPAGEEPAGVISPECGNGIREGDEECDLEPDCSIDCEWSDNIPECGNGVREADEECDGENNCAGDCTIIQLNEPECGNGVREGDEECDGEPNCTINCIIREPDPICGNGIREAGEECDGGPNCTNICTIMEPTSPVCGNGIREDGEACDGTMACSLDCTSYNGGEGPDTIVADDRDNRLRGNGGDDVLRGRDGNDEILGGAGNDSIEGGNGDDTLKGQGGNDQLRGGDGNDILEGGSGNDQLRGGSGTDHLYGEGGDDTYNYVQGDGVVHIYPNGGGNDRLWCRQGATVMRQQIRDANVRLFMTDGGRIVLHEQAINNGTTVDTIDCPGFEE